MDLIIHTYGHIDAMFYTLNALAMLMQSVGNPVLMAMGVLSVGYYSMKAAYSGHAFRLQLTKILGVVAMLYLFLLPTTEMLIFDHVSKKKEKVDNIPLGFALPVAILESFGNILTGGFEQAFGAVGSTSYREYGMVFGARLVQDSRQWRIRNPEFMENMASFVDRCIVIDSMIGYYYTPEKLVQTDDIWQLVSSNAGTLRQATIRQGSQRTLMSCKDAAHKVIEPAFKLEINALEERNRGTDFGEAGASNYVQRNFGKTASHFKKNVELAFQHYIGTTASAESIIRQQMMINAIKNFNDEYGYARAAATQESSWLIAGDLASTYLPILMSVLKCLTYGAFTIIVPFIVATGSWSGYSRYLMLVASFQLWAPLNAILNMFIDIYSSTSLSSIANHIVSFSTANKIGRYTDKIVAVANGLQMAIPYIAFTIIQGSISGIIQAAGNITAASQSAAAQAANESVTGNKSFDNYSVGNQQLHNNSGFKTDWNQSYASGGSSYQHTDGTMERVTAGGNTLMQSGIGLTASSGSTAYRQEDNRQAQVSEGIQVAESIHQQDARSVSSAESKHLAKASDYIAHLAEREHKGESFAYEKMGEEGESLRQAVSHAKQLHDTKGYGWQQSAKTSAEASVSAGFGIGIFSAKATTSGSMAAENNSTQAKGEETRINRDQNTEQSKTNIEKAMANSNWAKEQSIDTGYSDSVREAYEEVQRAEQQASISKQQVEDWHQAKTVVDSQSASSSRDMYQEVIEGIKQGHGVDAKTAHQLADQRSPEAQRVWQKLQNEDNYVQNIVADIEHSRAGVSGRSASQKLDQFTANSRIMNQDTGRNIRQHAASQGMNVNNFKDNIQEAQKNLKGQYTKITAENAKQYHAAKDNNKLEESRAKEQVAQYEEDRLGKSIGIGGPDGNTKSIVVDTGFYEQAKNIKDKKK